MKNKKSIQTFFSRRQMFGINMILLFVSQSIIAQINPALLNCSLPTSTIQNQAIGNYCTSNSSAFQNMYSQQHFYVPDAGFDPVITVDIVLHIFSPATHSLAIDPNPSLVWMSWINETNPSAPNGIPALMSFLAPITEGHSDRFSDERKFTYNGNSFNSSLTFPSGSYTSASGVTHDYDDEILDSRVQYHVAKIYFYDNDQLFLGNYSPTSLIDYIDQNHPTRLGEGIPIICSGIGSVSYGTYADIYNGIPYVSKPVSLCSALDSFGFQINLLHELGHLFGWLHNYGGKFNPINGSHYVSPISESMLYTNGNNTTPSFPQFGHVPYLNCLDPTFLHDVFPNNSIYGSLVNGTDLNPPSFNSCIGKCYETENGVYGSNNVMSVASPYNRWMSPLQQGRRIKTLHLNQFVRKYVEDLTSDHQHPWQITSNQLWDFDIQMYHDILIKSGNTLTITCKVAMPLEGRIIVEKGAMLVVDGGTVTTWCKSGTWDGIEAIGTPSVPHNIGFTGNYNTNHGYVKIINGSVISNANVAIKNYGHYNNNSNVNFATIGGILSANNSTFLNNWKDIEMLYFPHYPSWSHFTKCNFITTGPIVVNTPTFSPETHVTLWGVNGVSFRGCNFDRNTPLYSIGMRGGAIGSLNSFFIVDNALDGTNNTVNNLDFGVFAGNTNPLVAPVVANSKFISIYRDGIRFNGINNAIIQSNTLTSNSSMQNSSDIYLNSCKNYVVKNNQIIRSATNFQYGFGIATYNSQTGAHEIYRNSFQNCKYGVAAYGNNSGYNNVTDGLRINCNNFNFTNNSRKDIYQLIDPNTPTIAPTVKSVQGDYYGGNSYTLMVRNLYGANNFQQENNWAIDNINGVPNKQVVHYSNPATSLFPTNPVSKDAAVTVISNVAWPIYSEVLQCPSGLPSGGGTFTSSANQLSNINGFLSELRALNNAAFTQEIANAYDAKINLFLTDSVLRNVDSVIAIYKSKPAEVRDCDKNLVYAYLLKGDIINATIYMDSLSACNQSEKIWIQQQIYFMQHPEQLFNYGKNDSLNSVLSAFTNYFSSSWAGAKHTIAFFGNMDYEVPRNIPEEVNSGGRKANHSVVDNVNIEALTEYSVFPSPSTGRVFVNLPKNERARITVTDLLGRTVKELPVSMNMQMVELTLSTGTYVIEIRDNDELKFTTKILIMN